MSVAPLIIPSSAIIPTRDRSKSLRQTLLSLSAQSVQPAEIIVNDASEDNATQDVCAAAMPGLRSKVRYFRAQCVGAAAQRNEAIQRVSQAVVLLMDDDILFEPDCLSRMWGTLNADPKFGGVGATITNQNYGNPSMVTRIVFSIMAGKAAPSYAGRVLGPAVNLLPEDRSDLPEVVPVEWLNLGCVLYRTEALPNPPFPIFFTGYSLMEDVTLSLTVGKSWKLVNARTARIYHDSQPGSHKSDPAELAEMAIVNRVFVMKEVLGRTSISDYARLVLWLLYHDLGHLKSSKHRGQVPARLWGELRGLVRVINGS